MDRRWLQVTYIALVVVVTATTTTTLSSAQQTSAVAFPALPSCPPAPLSLSPCIGYVFGVGSTSLASCCSQLRGFLQAQAPCLCAASKLAPSPVGLFLGQAQAMIPNVCDLPNPCDAAEAAAGEGSTPAVSTPKEAGTSPPSATTPETTTPATEPSSGTPAAADPNTSGAPPAPTEDASATAAAPVGSGYKLPELLHAAGATSSRDVSAGTVFVAVFLASVATMYV